MLLNLASLTIYYDNFIKDINVNYNAMLPQ